MICTHFIFFCSVFSWPFQHVRIILSRAVQRSQERGQTFLCIELRVYLLWFLVLLEAYHFFPRRRSGFINSAGVWVYLVLSTVSPSPHLCYFIGKAHLDSGDFINEGNSDALFCLSQERKFKSITENTFSCCSLSLCSRPPGNQHR